MSRDDRAGRPVVPGATSPSLREADALTNRSIAGASAARGGLGAYVAAETLVGAGMNTLMSLVFAWLVFHGHARASFAAIVFDAIPQSFMVGLMSVLPVSFLTRRRARNGRGLPSPPARSFRGPTRLAVRAPVVAVATGLIGFVIFRILSPLLFPAGLTFGHLLVLKAGWAVLLSLVLVPFAAIAALADAA